MLNRTVPLSSLLLLIVIVVQTGTAANGASAPFVYGLKPGDSWGYDIELSCQEDCPITEQPSSAEATVLDVKSGPECIIVDCGLTLGMIETFANASVVERTLFGNLWTGSGNLSAYVLVPGLTAGDLMPVESLRAYEQARLSFSGPPRVNSTISMNVAGVERTVNMLNVSLSSGVGRAIFLWDQPTGVLVQFHADAEGIFDWTIMMSDTNIWNVSWRVGSTWILNRGLEVPGNYATFNGALEVPTSVAFNPTNNRIYVTSGHSLQTGRSSNIVSVIEAASNRIVGEVPVDDPRSIAYYPPKNQLYVTSTPGVTIIDGETDKVVGNITFGSGTAGIAYNPNNNYLYVANHDSNTVSVLDGATNVEVASITVGDGPMGIAVDPVNHYVYANCFGSGVVSVISDIDHTFVADVTITSAPSPPPIGTGDQVFQNIAYDSSNNNMYLFNGYPRRSARTIHVVSGLTLVENITLTSGPSGILYHPSSNKIYVAKSYSSSFDTGTVSVVDPDTKTVVRELGVGQGATGLAYNTVNQYVYVANARSDSVSIIDSRTDVTVGLVLTEVYPSGVAYNREENIVYASNSGSLQAAAWKDSVSQTVFAVDLDTGAVSPVVTGGRGPAGMVFDPSNGYLYVAHLFSGGVSVIDGSTLLVVGNIPIVGFNHIGIEHNPDQRLVYVASQGGFTPPGWVSVIDERSNTVIGNITVSYFPVSLAYSPSNRNLYVSHYPLEGATGQGSVTVINTLTNTVVANLTLPGESAPLGVAYNPANGDVYVADYLAKAILVVDSDTNAIVDTISVDMRPQNLIVDADRNEIFVTGTLPGSYEFPVDNTVTVLSGASNTVLGSFKLGYDPAGGAYDAANGRLFVANYMSGTVSTVHLSTSPSTPPGSAGPPMGIFGLQPEIFYGLVAGVAVGVVGLGLFAAKRRWARTAQSGVDS